MMSLKNKLSITLAMLGIFLSSYGCFIVKQSEGTISYRSPKGNSLQITSSKDDASKDAKISVPPDLIDLAGQLRIEEGATVASEPLAAALNIGEGLQTAGPSVNVSSLGSGDITQYGRLEMSLPYDQAASLTMSASFLVVVYQVIGADGKVLIGLIPASSYAIDQSFIKFRLLGLGSYQAVRIAIEVKEEIKVQTEETKILTKVEQEVLPALSLASVNPVITRKGQLISIKGQNFREGIKLAYLGRALSQVQIKSDQLLTAVIDDASRRGQGLLYASQDGVEKTMSLAYAGASGDFPLITLAASEVCLGQKFYNDNGDLLEGSKICAQAPACASDGQTNCVASAAFPAVQPSLVATKCLAGETLGGMTGTVTLPAVSKVLTGTSYGVSGTGLAGSLTLPLASNVLAGTTAYGEVGSLLTPSFTADFPAAANVRANDTVNGVTGTLIDCSAANQDGCVATATYKTMDLSAASATTDLSSSNFNATIKTAGNFEFWDSTGMRYQLAGDTNLVAGNISTGATIFGVAGSAATSPVCSANGAQSCVASGTYFAATACAAGGTNCFVPAYVATTQPLKAISYDAIDAGKTSIRSTLTLAGIAGTLTDCASDGSAGCVVVGPTYAALLKTNAQDKILSGQTLGGVAGNVTLPLAAKVLTGTSYGVSGTGSTGTLTLPAAADVLLGSSAYGEASAQLTPSYAPDFPSTSNVRDSDTVDGVSGTLVSCSAANQSACVATSTYKTMDLSGATATTDLTSSNFNTSLSSGADFEFWDSYGSRYQMAGNSSLNVSNVKAGVVLFGVTGEYPSATYPLPGATGTADLDTATFNVKIKSSAAFEYWNQEGVQQTGAGDADLTAANIASTASIFGTTGTVPVDCAHGSQSSCEADNSCRWTGSICEVDAWNIRVGTSLGGMTGSLKTSCRNRSNASIWDTSLPYLATTLDATLNTLTIPGHPFTSNMPVRVGGTTTPTGITLNSTTYYVIVTDTNTIKLSATSGPGTEIDFTAVGSMVTVSRLNDGSIQSWDTIDDGNNNLVFPTSLVTGWGTSTDCNHSNWQDLTTDGACNSAADDCIMKDRMSGLMWSESYPAPGTAAGTAGANWQKAIVHCENLIFGSFTDWRLATQKELMEAYVHGIRDVGYTGVGTISGSGSTNNNNQFILNVDGTFWSASVMSGIATSAFYASFDTGELISSAKTNANQILCVR